jgi:chaperonin cofactor prefoldin
MDDNHSLIEYKEEVLDDSIHDLNYQISALKPHLQKQMTKESITTLDLNE